MAKKNALLFSWANGYDWRVDSAAVTADGRRETAAALDSARDLTEAYASADAILANLTSRPVAYTAGVQALVPWADYNPGDPLTVDGATPRVLAVTVYEDDQTGQARFTPELGSVKETATQRLARAVERMSAGSQLGRSELVGRVSEQVEPFIPPQNNRETVTWGSTGTPTASQQTPPFPVMRSHALVRGYITRSAGTTAMTVTIYKNGVSTGHTISTSATGTLASGGPFTEALVAGSDVLTAAVTTVGTGTTDVGVHLELL